MVDLFCIAVSTSHRHSFSHDVSDISPRESFIGRETVWTGWHKRPAPRDPRDTRDKCALRCAVDPEKKKEKPCKPTGVQLRKARERTIACEEAPYTIDYDTHLDKVKYGTRAL